MERVQSFLARFHQHSPSFSNTTQLFLQELLSPRGERQTLEATKIQEYVNECLQAASRSDGVCVCVCVCVCVTDFALNFS